MAEAHGRIVRLAVFGCGFWSHFQIAGWRELPGAQVVAVYNRTLSKAAAVAAKFGIGSFYDDPVKCLEQQQIDALDIITDVETHEPFVSLAAKYRKSVICQKPMAPTMRQAVAMVATCRAAGVEFYVNENFRHQAPLRALKRVLDSGVIGPVFRARLDFIHGFAVFGNQPFLRELKQFILTDVGSHIFDVARFLFGEARSLYCRTQKIHHDIAGEDVATAMLDMGDKVVTCHMAYAENPQENEAFPQTLAFVEGEKGTIQLCPNFWIRVTTKSGTHSYRAVPPRYAWADPAYDLVHASIVPCQADLLGGLLGIGRPETTAQDNLKTVRLVYGAYASARLGRPVDPARDDWFDASMS